MQDHEESIDLDAMESELEAIANEIMNTSVGSVLPQSGREPPVAQTRSTTDLPSAGADSRQPRAPRRSRSEQLNPRQPAVPPSAVTQQGAPAAREPAQPPAERVRAQDGSSPSHAQHASVSRASAHAQSSPRAPASPDAPAAEAEAAPFRWQRAEMIGSGSFGKVFLGLNLSSGEMMAVKQIHIGPHMGENGAELLSSIQREVALLQGLRHPNIVTYLGVERDEAEGTLSIFLEYVAGGSIHALLARFGALNEKLARRYVRHITQGVAYLHAHRIVHRDIKGANVLVDHQGVCKLADFGASRKIADILGGSNDARSLKGTPFWMAPEVIKQTGHGPEADIWSLGCTLIEMVTGACASASGGRAAAGLRAHGRERGRPALTHASCATRVPARARRAGKPPWSHFNSQISALFHIASAKTPPPLPDCLSPMVRARARVRARWRGLAALAPRRGAGGRPRGRAQPHALRRGVCACPRARAQGKSFLEQCLRRNPKERPSALQLLTHEWLTVTEGALPAGPVQQLVRPPSAPGREPRLVAYESSARLLDGGQDSWAGGSGGRTALVSKTTSQSAGTVLLTRAQDAAPGGVRVPVVPAKAGVPPASSVPALHLSVHAPRAGAGAGVGAAADASAHAPPGHQPHLGSRQLGLQLGGVGGGGGADGGDAYTPRRAAAARDAFLGGGGAAAPVGYSPQLQPQAGHAHLAQSQQHGPPPAGGYAHAPPQQWQAHRAGARQQPFAVEGAWLPPPAEAHGHGPHPAGGGESAHASVLLADRDSKRRQWELELEAELARQRQEKAAREQQKRAEHAELQRSLSNATGSCGAGSGAAHGGGAVRGSPAVPRQPGGGGLGPHPARQVSAAATSAANGPSRAHR